jgi:hypothetical protein
MPMHPVMRLTGVVLVSLAAVLAVLWFLGAQAVVPPAGSLLIIVAAVGAVVGWLVAPRVPIWIALALPAAGVGALALGFSDYNDDGPSGPLFEPMVFIGARVVPVLVVFTGAVAVAGRLRHGADS